jgi:nitrous oxidase accessory protein NosD
MAYTLTGRLETRLAAAIWPLLAAAPLTAVLHKWWPLEAAGLMLGVGVAADLLYDRVLDYQPGWYALPLGLAELGATYGLAQALDVHAPLGPAVALFAGGWLAQQVLSHAGLPLVRLSYADDGGELGPAGAALVAGVLAFFAGAGAAAWTTHPPTVHLAAGIHKGPIVITHAQTLTGPPEAIVTGGIVVRASQVHIHGLTVLGGENGIEIDGVRDVVVRGTRIRGAQLDGIHVRRATVTLRDCRVDSGANPWAQGIDISYAFDKEPSLVEGCVVIGGREGIVTHFVNAMLVNNRVEGTSLRGIAMTEMSMGGVERNHVRSALGVGIFCGDHSMCMVERNRVVGTRPDPASGDPSRNGFGLVVQYGADAELGSNQLGGSGVGLFSDGHVSPLP